MAAAVDAPVLMVLDAPADLTAEVHPVLRGKRAAEPGCMSACDHAATETHRACHIERSCKHLIIRCLSISSAPDVIHHGMRIKAQLHCAACKCSAAVRQQPVLAHGRTSSTRRWQPRTALRRRTLRCWAWCSTRRALLALLCIFLLDTGSFMVGSTTGSLVFRVRGVPYMSWKACNAHVTAALLFDLLNRQPQPQGQPEFNTSIHHTTKDNIICFGLQMAPNSEAASDEGGARLSERLQGAGLQLFGSLPRDALLASVRMDEIQAALQARPVAGGAAHPDARFDKARPAVWLEPCLQRHAQKLAQTGLCSFYVLSW